MGARDVSDARIFQRCETYAYYVDGDAVALFPFLTSW